MKAPKIVPVDEAGDYRTGELPSSITPKRISEVLGFEPNIDDDGDKVEYSWGFLVDGHRCGIWDYKGFRWSVYDPGNVLSKLNW